MKYRYLVWPIVGAEGATDVVPASIDWYKDPLPARNWEVALGFTMASLIDSCWRSVLIYEELPGTQHRRAVMQVCIGYVGTLGLWLDLSGVYELAHRDMSMALADLNNQFELAAKE